MKSEEESSVHYQPLNRKQRIESCNITRKKFINILVSVSRANKTIKISVVFKRNIKFSINLSKRKIKTYNH